jgi:phage terminase large subunit-like protein
VSREINIDTGPAFKYFYESKRYAAIHGGRGSGKSHGAADAITVLGYERPLRIVCLREVQKSIKDSSKQLLADKINKSGLDQHYKVLESEIRGANGTTFTFHGLGTMTADSIKSMEAIDIAWVEEAHTISQKSLEILIPTIRKAGSRIWFTWNPRSKDDPVDKRFRGSSPPEDAIIKELNYYDNPFFPGELDKEREYDLRASHYRYGHVWLGEYEPSALGALWTQQLIESSRIAPEDSPEMVRLVIAVDPAVTSDKNSSETGIVVGGLDSEGKGHVLDDLSFKGTPGQVAQRVSKAARQWDVDRVIGEVNNGGEWIGHALHQADPTLPYKAIRASRGKAARAEPITALYEQGKIHHDGIFPELETQMCTWEPLSGNKSPDRLDALVWCMTELLLNRGERKKIRLKGF